LISYNYFGKEELKIVPTEQEYLSVNRRVEIIKNFALIEKSDIPVEPTAPEQKPQRGLSLKDLEANAIFFLLDVLLTILLIPIILKYRNRNKVNHLTKLTLTAINELMEIGGSMMIKFNQVGFRLYDTTENIKNMTVQERAENGFTPARMNEFHIENLNWLIQYSGVYEKEINSFRSTIELFTPHFEEADILILISKLNQNSRYAITSMEAIILSFRLGGQIPDDLFGSINGAYQKMYDDVIEASNKKQFYDLQKPKTIEEIYNSLNDGEYFSMAQPNA